MGRGTWWWRLSTTRETLGRPRQQKSCRLDGSSHNPCCSHHSRRRPPADNLSQRKQKQTHINLLYRPFTHPSVSRLQTIAWRENITRQSLTLSPLLVSLHRGLYHTPSLPELSAKMIHLSITCSVSISYFCSDLGWMLAIYGSISPIWAQSRSDL